VGSRIVTLVAAAALFSALSAIAHPAAAFARSSDWCGSPSSTDRVPDLPAGPDIHVLYVTAADRPDNFAANAGPIADSVASVVNWWPTQDFTRTPRFDMYPFDGCGAAGGLDLSDVHLSEPSGDFTATSLRFTNLWNDLGALGFNSRYKKYLVFYDGPALDPDICGEGGGDLSVGPGFAIVYLQSCENNIDHSAVAAHELIHALIGHLPSDATNPCPNDPWHPCDSPYDVLYPYVTESRPLAYDTLDVNHDDYYATVESSPWLRHLDTPSEPVSVTIAGGAGSVTSDVPGVICTASCSVPWDQGSQLTLTAQPAAGERFIGWTGGCAGDAVCPLTLDTAKTVTALFGPAAVPITTSVTGQGKVACSPACSSTFTAGNYLELRAVPAIGWRFVRWSGACSGPKATCSPGTDAAVTVHATFAKAPVKAKPKAKARAKAKAKPKKR
jgi:hypothetical protein